MLDQVRWIDQTDRETDCSRRAAVWALLLILFTALLWRCWVLVQMPCISRDGVLYCWQARDLGQRGAALLATREYDQHPLYATTILAVQRLSLAVGAPDHPLAWQRAGQAVSMTNGLIVIWLCYLLTGRLVSRSGLAIPPRKAGLFAAGLAALLPLNVWLSVDVMSESLFFAFYLAAIWAAVSRAGIFPAAGVGACSGAAFLVRPEGVVALLAGMLPAVRTSDSPVHRIRIILSALFAFSVAAGPYVLMSGGLSPKFHKEPLTQNASSDAGAKSDSHAALVREAVPWFAALPRAILETGRAGRVVIPVLALFALWSLRGVHRPALLPPLLAAAGQCMLGALLVWRYGYLAPRHMLSVVFMLLPFAALVPFMIPQAVRAAKRATDGPAIRSMRILLMAVALLVPGTYALRIPNAHDAHLRQAADWLAAQPGITSDSLLLGGSHERRIAFYAGMRFQPWPENIADPDARYRALVEHLLHFRPRVFAMETSYSPAQQELRGNQELADRILVEAALVDHIVAKHAVAGSDQRLLQLALFEF